MAYVVGNSERTKYRSFDAAQGGFIWVDDIEKAIHYARRSDAELVHGDDDEAWSITHIEDDRVISGTPTPRAIDMHGDAKYNVARMTQYEKDRSAWLATMSIDDYIAFALRWGFAPPAGGFGDRDTLLCLMHRVRLIAPDTAPFLKHISAAHLVSHGIQLPGTLRFEDGVLKGEAW